MRPPGPPTPHCCVETRRPRRGDAGPGRGELRGAEGRPTRGFLRAGGCGVAAAAEGGRSSRASGTWCGNRLLLGGPHRLPGAQFGEVSVFRQGRSQVRRRGPNCARRGEGSEAAAACPRAVPWVQSAHMTVAFQRAQQLLGNLLINTVFAKPTVTCMKGKGLQGAVKCALLSGGSGGGGGRHAPRAGSRPVGNSYQLRRFSSLISHS